MPKFKKKPVEIEAEIWTGDNTTDILKHCDRCYSYKKGEKTILVINTLEGTMTASMGDYIIKGVQGEFYACKPDIFRLTYDEVTD